MQTLADAEKIGRYTDAVVNHFKQNVVDYCGSLDPIKLLGKKEWELPESRHRFLSFMDAVSCSIVTYLHPLLNQSLTALEILL